MKALSASSFDASGITSPAARFFGSVKAVCVACGCGSEARARRHATPQSEGAFLLSITRRMQSYVENFESLNRLVCQERSWKPQDDQANTASVASAQACALFACRVPETPGDPDRQV